jgi:hypothetical protein
VILTLAAPVQFGPQRKPVSDGLRFRTQFGFLIRNDARLKTPRVNSLIEGIKETNLVRVPNQTKIDGELLVAPRRNGIVGSTSCVCGWQWSGAATC